MCHHLTIVLNNRPGELHSVARKLEQSGINILAFHLATSGANTGYAQIACTQHKSALASLSEVYGPYVYATEVVAIEGEHKPGFLADILSVFYKQNVNIDNAYQTITRSGRAVVIIEPPSRDLAEAIRIATQKFDVLDSLDSINIS